MFQVFSIAYLADLLNITEREFHRETKPFILRDFKTELTEKTINNPDIGLDSNDEIFLVDPTDSKNYIETGIEINCYL